MAVALIAALAGAALTVPIPTPIELRTWVSSAGATGVLLLLLAYAVLTVAPIPRTVFNLVAGLLLGDIVGIGVALIATVISGALGFALARLLGGGLLDRALHRDSARAVHQRLAHAGTLSVTSLRLIPFRKCVKACTAF